MASASGGFWGHLGALSVGFWALWVPLGLSGGLKGPLKPLGASGGFWNLWGLWGLLGPLGRLGAFGGLWGPLGASGASGCLWGPLLASGGPWGLPGASAGLFEKICFCFSLERFLGQDLAPPEPQEKELNEKNGSRSWAFWVTSKDAGWCACFAQPQAWISQICKI